MRIRSGTAQRAGVAAAALVMALSLAACSGDDDDGDDGDAETPGATETPPAVVSSRVVVGEVTGRLAPSRRDEVTEEVGGIVTRWIEAAYFGDAPDIKLDDAFPGFTEGAEELARRDKWLMSNASLPRNVDEVTPVGKQLVRVDLLAVRQRVVGATARFLVVFDTVAGKTKKVTVRGRVVLSRNDRGNWAIFAYDAGRWAKVKGAKS